MISAVLFDHDFVSDGSLTLRPDVAEDLHALIR